MQSLAQMGLGPQPSAPERSSSSWRATQAPRAAWSAQSLCAACRWMRRRTSCARRCGLTGPSRPAGQPGNALGSLCVLPVSPPAPGAHRSGRGGGSGRCLCQLPAQDDCAMDTAERALPGLAPAAGALPVEHCHTLMPRTCHSTLLSGSLPAELQRLHPVWLLQAGQGQDVGAPQGHRLCGVPQASRRCCRLRSASRQVRSRATACSCRCSCSAAAASLPAVRAGHLPCCFASRCPAERAGAAAAQAAASWSRGAGARCPWPSPRMRPARWPRAPPSRAGGVACTWCGSRPDSCALAAPPEHVSAVQPRGPAGVGGWGGGFRACAVPATIVSSCSRADYQLCWLNGSFRAADQGGCAGQGRGH